jgi:hypothetical protein
MFNGTMDLTPLLCIIRATKMPLFFLIRGLLLAIPVIFVVSVIFVISPVSCVDFPIVLFLLRGPLAVRLKNSIPGLESLNTYVSNCEQIGHHFGILHGDLLYSLDVTDSVMEGIDNFDVLDVWDSVLDII